MSRVPDLQECMRKIMNELASNYYRSYNQEASHHRETFNRMRKSMPAMLHILAKVYKDTFYGLYTLPLRNSNDYPCREMDPPHLFDEIHAAGYSHQPLPFEKFEEFYRRLLNLQEAYEVLDTKVAAELLANSKLRAKLALVRKLLASNIPQDVLLAMFDYV